MLRLIGHYQAGHPPTPELALRPGPLPKFDGGSSSSSSSNMAVQPPPGPPPSALQAQTSGSTPIRVPPLSPEKATQYAQLFEKSGPQHGVLPGELAKQIFERAGLPNEVLGRIWNLADRDQKGALLATEFVIAMHLIAAFKTGSLRALPGVLPAGLYEAAARRAPSRQSSGAMSAIPRQLSGQARTGSPLQRGGFAAAPQIPHGTGDADWAISAADKVKFDGIYSGLDRTNKGYITGDEAVPFFSESKLPEEALAQIWDLADINSSGHLTRDEFAVAMYLIRQQRGKRDGRDNLPAVLPTNLVPPSMRSQVRPQSETTAPAFDGPAPVLAKSAAEDLFGLDALTSPSLPGAPVQVPQSTGGSTGMSGSRHLPSDPFANAPSSLTPNHTAQSQQSSMFKAFVPSSSFGQSLTQHTTGGSSSSGPSRSIPPPSAMDDLLGDNDPEISKRLTSETSELANLSNQVGNLSKQMHEVQGQRATSQAELNQASSQKKQFEERLTQLRSLYEQEAKDVKALEEKLAASRGDTKKLQNDFTILDATYRDLQGQRQQILEALQVDQQENASLKDRMRVMNAEITQMKPALEKLRSDARQQKGLVAINKKQLATNEAEKDRLKQEAEELKRTIDEDAKALTAAAKVQTPQSTTVSPAPSSMSANNPFFRRQSSLGGDIASSPFPANPSKDQSFDAVFGPSFPGQGSRSTTGKQNPEPRAGTPDSLSLPARTHSRDGKPHSSGEASREASGQQAPPPPPESRQISSSFLPFPASMRQDSVSSSRQVSAPNSRFGDESTSANTPTAYLSATPTGSSIAGQSEPARGASPSKETTSHSASAPEHKDSIPGAFPSDNSEVLPTPTGESQFERGVADGFGTKDPSRSAHVKDDFDAAFAGLGGSSRTADQSSSDVKGKSEAPAGLIKEFPPITQLEHDDDSDSASDDGGFDDDFVPASPGAGSKGKKDVPGQSIYNNGTAVDDYMGPPVGAGRSTDPPTPNAQASPPTYDKAVSPSDQAHIEVQQFSGLLPSREPPHSTDALTNSFPLPGTSTTYGGQPQTTSTTRVAFDDDFDEFEDLEDAKEGDADDDFANMSAMSTQSRPGLDDFNPVFDSPPITKSTNPAPNTATFGSSTRSGFGNFTEEPGAMSPPPPASKASPVNDSHDWDAIFAGLDGPMGTTSQLGEPLKGGATNTAAPANADQHDRPQVGRALTNTGTHDDPILKNLTSMGYNRTDALSALEKYDYNLERVSCFPAVLTTECFQVIANAKTGGQLLSQPILITATHASRRASPYTVFRTSSH